MARNFATALTSRPVKATINFANVAPTSGDSLGTGREIGAVLSRWGPQSAVPILHLPSL